MHILETIIRGKYNIEDKYINIIEGLKIIIIIRIAIIPIINKKANFLYLTELKKIFPKTNNNSHDEAIVISLSGNLSFEENAASVISNGRAEKCKNFSICSQKWFNNNVYS